MIIVSVTDNKTVLRTIRQQFLLIEEHFRLNNFTGCTKLDLAHLRKRKFRAVVGQRIQALTTVSV
jgi:hypothetical protein